MGVLESIFKDYTYITVTHSKVLSVEKAEWKYNFDWLQYCFAIVLAMGQSFTYTFALETLLHFINIPTI